MADTGNISTSNTHNKTEKGPSFLLSDDFPRSAPGKRYKTLENLPYEGPYDEIDPLFLKKKADAFLYSVTAHLTRSLIEEQTKSYNLEKKYKEREAKLIDQSRNLLAENNHLHTVIKTERESFNRKVDSAIQDAKQSAAEASLEARLKLLEEFVIGDRVSWDDPGWDKKLKGLMNERMVEKELVEDAEKDAGTQGVAEKGEGCKGGDGGDEMIV